MTTPPKPDLTYQDWEKLALAQAQTIQTLEERVAHWMKRCSRAEQEMMRLLRERGDALR